MPVRPHRLALGESRQLVGAFAVLGGGGVGAPEVYGGLVEDYVLGGATYRKHTFYGNATLDVVVPPASFDVLVVGGGGGGGGSNGGGGGGGRVIEQIGYVLAAGSYPVAVGQGGEGGYPTAGNLGQKGANSSLSTLVAEGGGGGAGSGAEQGQDGGSGGGGGGLAGGLASPGLGLGNPGGEGNRPWAGSFSPGGGGGAGAPGANGVAGAAGAGGVGVSSSISGLTLIYGGGGGGGGASGAAGAGGLGGGGAGRTQPGDPSGLSFTGGGGGGQGLNSSVPAGAGGSGIVIVRYVITPPVPAAGEVYGGLIEDYAYQGIRYRKHVFVANGTLDVVQQPSSGFEILVVGGGGSGGGVSGAGGGAGRVIRETGQMLAVGSYPVVVGAGGPAGVAFDYKGQNGSPSSIASFSAPGGGGGGTLETGFRAGSVGGSSGGTVFDDPTTTPDIGGPGYGNPGGRTEGLAPAWNFPFPAPGGGGAGGSGGVVRPAITPGGGTKGGDGLPDTILGTQSYFGGGGGGASFNGAVSQGGLGGGGVGNTGPGTPNTGGGGGGKINNNRSPGGVGGSGIVVVRYKIPDAPVLDTDFPVAWRAASLDGANNTTFSPTRPLNVKAGVGPIRNLGFLAGTSNVITQANGAGLLVINTAGDDLLALSYAGNFSQGTAGFDFPQYTPAVPWCVGMALVQQPGIPNYPFDYTEIFLTPTILAAGSPGQGPDDIFATDSGTPSIPQAGFVQRPITAVLGWDGTQNFVELKNDLGVTTVVQSSPQASQSTAAGVFFFGRTFNWFTGGNVQVASRGAFCPYSDIAKLRNWLRQ